MIKFGTRRSGTEHIDGSSADDNLNGAGGADTLIGGAPGQIRYYDNGVDTFIELNTGNVLAADAAIHLSGLHTPDASWFGAFL